MKEVEIFGGATALVDDEDYDLVSQYRWYLDRSPRATTSYAVTQTGVGRKGRRNLWMHQVILGAAPSGCFIDHKNRDGLDNRRSNLRWATLAQQRWNQAVRRDSKSGFKGVQLTQGKYWVASIRCNGKRTYIGCFGSAEEAARAYDAKARELHGDFAYVNFPQGTCKGTP